MAVNYAGTISVTNGSAVVTGTGTEWTTLTVASDYILVTADGTICKVSALASSTELTLTKNYAGATASNVEYEIFPTIGADVELGLLVKAFIDDARDIIDGGAALLTALQAAYDTWIADRQAEFDAAQSQRATDFTAAQDARASQFATDRAQQDLDIANAMNGLEGAPIAKAIPSGAIDMCAIKGASILDLNGGWTRDMSKSWAKEDRVTTTYLGVHNTTASAWAVPGAAAGDWYWDGTNRNIYILTGTAGATLSTLNRFGAAHFDAQFVVAYSDRVVLVDDDGVPWMVFLRGVGYAATNGTISCIEFCGDTLWIGTNTGGWGMSEISFAGDGYQYRWTNGVLPNSNDVANRNSQGSHALLAGSQGIAHLTINAVAATVLPNAPADPVTGLPIARIYVGHDAGIEAILEDGSIVTSSYSLAVGSIAVSDHGVWWNRNTSTYVLGFATHKDVESGSGWGDTVAQTVAGSGDFDLLVRGNQMTAFGDLLALSGTSPVSDAVAGLMIHWPNYSDPSKGLSSVFNPDFVTPPMFGDVKTALFCERGAASLVDAGEVNSEPDFANSGADWHANAGFTKGLGTMTADPSYGGTLFYHLTDRVEVGEQAYTKIVVDSITQGTVGVSYDTGGITEGMEITAPGTYYFVDRMRGNTLFYVRSVNSDAVVSYFGWGDVTPDRSVSGKGAVIHGNLSRDADGWVSGFSASDYVEQPFNPDLDFGTGDFYVGVEYRAVDSTTYGMLFSRGSSTSNDTFFYNNNGPFQVRVGNGGTQTTGFIFQDNTSYHLTLVRRSGTAYVYVDGVEVFSFASAQDLNIPNAPLRLGRRIGQSATALASGRIRKWFIGAGAPSPAQIRIMSNWKGDVIEGAIHDTSYVESTQGLWVLTSAYCYEIGPDGAERSKQVNDIGATTLVAYFAGRLVS